MYRIFNGMRNMLFGDKREYLPSKEDLECKDIKELSGILKGDSDVKTLTNILEWQERNIRFWSDRWYIFSIFSVMIVVSLLLVELLAIYVLSNILLVLLPLFLILPWFLIYLIYRNINIYVYLLQQTLLLSYLLVAFREVIPPKYLICLAIVLGGNISLISYMIMRYLIRERNVNKLLDAFENSLSVEKFLKYRLAVCKDYAKLTATLLFNICPKNEIYFIKIIPSHVATGIKIKDKIYVLDQKLPVTTLERWMSYWKSRLNKKSLDITILKAVYQEGEIEISNEDKKEVKNLSIPIVDVNSLRKKLLEELDIKKMATSSEIEKFKPIPIPLKDMALKYENDEIVEYSIIRAFKNKILNEFCGNIKKITNVEVQQDGKDIVLNVYHF